MAGHLYHDILVLERFQYPLDHCIRLWVSINNKERLEPHWIKGDSCTVHDWYIPHVNGHWRRDSKFHVTLAMRYCDLESLKDQLEVFFPNEDQLLNAIEDAIKFGNVLGKIYVSVSMQFAVMLFEYTRDCADIVYGVCQSALLNTRVIRVFKIALYKVELSSLRKDRDTLKDVLYGHMAHIEPLRLVIKHGSHTVIDALATYFNERMYKIQQYYGTPTIEDMERSYIARISDKAPTDTFDHVLYNISKDVKLTYKKECIESGVFAYISAAVTILASLIAPPSVYS